MSLSLSSSWNRGDLHLPQKASVFILYHVSALEGGKKPNSRILSQVWWHAAVEEAGGLEPAQATQQDPSSKNPNKSMIGVMFTILNHDN